ncbi:MAG TPA: M23 family metallopeptidase [Chitinophagaceae bacterium]|nr:M23 family metallopeptidase [Chitinophagaceae bacterium]
MKRKTEKTTILFVNKNQQAIKPIQVSNSLLINWKKYVSALSLLFIGLIGTIVYLTNHYIQQDKLQLALSQKLTAMHLELDEVDTAAVRQKFTKIDKQLSTINGFLKARGIKNVNNGEQGGEEDHDIISSAEISNFYENYLNRIIHNISYTPLGLPYQGAITSTFGHRENPFSGTGIETHKGLDIQGPYGAQVKAMAIGTVAFAGPKGGYGNCIILKHSNGFETLYGHLSKILVRAGEQIDIGQLIGNIGSTGRSTGPHLHYEIHQFGQKINPQAFLNLN